MTDVKSEVLCHLANVIAEVGLNNRKALELGAYSSLRDQVVRIQTRNEVLASITESLCSVLRDDPEEWEYRWVPVTMMGERWMGRSKEVADKDFEYGREGGPGHLSWSEPDDYDFLVRVDCERRRAGGVWTVVE